MGGSRRQRRASRVARLTGRQEAEPDSRPSAKEAHRDPKNTGAPRALEAGYRRFWSIDQNRPPSRL